MSELIKCPTCKGRGKIERKTLRIIYRQDKERVLKLIEQEGANKPPCDTAHCVAHVEQNEIQNMTSWNPSKVKQMREALQADGEIQTTKERPLGGIGAGVIVWHRLKVRV